MQPRSSFYLSLAIASLSLVAAFDLSNLPPCAQAPALSSIGSTGCGLTDFVCICKDQSFINSLTPVIQKDCSAADVQKVYEFTQQFCGSVGVSITSPTATASPTGSTTPSAATGSSGTSVSGTTAAGANSTSAASSNIGRLDGPFMIFGVVGIAVSWFF